MLKEKFLDGIVINKSKLILTLRKDLAEKAFQKEINSVKTYKDIQDRANLIIEKYVFSSNNNILHFAVNKKTELTYLLLNCNIPGRNYRLALRNQDRTIKNLKQEKPLTKDLKYSLYNIENSNQADALLSVWLEWVKLI